MTESHITYDDFFTSLNDHINEHVKPVAQNIDRDTNALAKAFTDINEKFLSKLWFSEPLNASPRALTSDLVLGLIAESSGALAFTAAQFMGACRRVEMSSNMELKRRVAAEILAGRLTIGVGTSHLKPGPSVVNARKVEGGFVIEGIVPWVSGHGIFSTVLVAARVGINGVLVVLLDLPKSDRDSTGHVSVSAPFDLIAMNSTKTVSVMLRECFVKEDDVVSYAPDSITPLPPSLPPFYGFQIGCARAALQLADDSLGKYQTPAIAEHLQSLHGEVASCAKECREIFYLTERDEIMTRTIKARTWLDSIIMRCIYAAMPLLGGQSNRKGSEMARIAGEAMVYVISLQNEAIIASKLESLVRRKST